LPSELQKRLHEVLSDVTKVGDNSDIAKENEENVSEDTAEYRIREDEELTEKVLFSFFLTF